MVITTTIQGLNSEHILKELRHNSEQLRQHLNCTYEELQIYAGSAAYYRLQDLSRVYYELSSPTTLDGSFTFLGIEVKRESFNNEWEIRMRRKDYLWTMNPDDFFEKFDSRLDRPKFSILPNFFDEKEKEEMLKILQIEKVIYNKPATIVIWKDGTKTVVKTQKGEKFDKEKGLAMAMCKRMYNNKGNYNNVFRKWCK